MIYREKTREKKPGMTMWGVGEISLFNNEKRRKGEEDCSGSPPKLFRLKKS